MPSSSSHSSSPKKAAKPSKKPPRQQQQSPVQDAAALIDAPSKEVLLADAVRSEAEELMAGSEKSLDELTLDNIIIKEPGSTENKKISPAYKKKLQSIGITEPMGLAVAIPEDLVNYLGIARDVAANMISSAQTLLADNSIIDKGIITAAEELERRKRVKFLTTGAKALDEILKGGIETAAVTEIYSDFGSGKTQLCFSLAVNSQLPVEKGGLGGKVLWIDTEHTFRGERVEQIAEAKGMDSAAVIDGIMVSSIKNSAHLDMFVKELSRLIRVHKFKLIIVDSIIALHRAEFAGRGTLYDRQHKLNIIMNQLTKLADFFNIAVVITNQVSSSPDTYFGDPVKPTGGNVLAHSSTYRLSIRKGSGGVRVVRIVDSPYHPYVDCKIQIDKEGVIDVKEEK